MLHHLFIKNYAIIEELDINFQSNLNIITGETGAGKSILLGALGLIAGKRADTSSLLNTEEKCVIEAAFLTKKFDLSFFFQENDLDYDQNQIIIRREINTAGKSRAFINDSPVSLEILKELTEKLIDIHSQHDHLLILNSDYQLNFIDSFAKIKVEVAQYQKEYKELLALKKDIIRIKESSQKSKQESDFLSFLYKELNEASLKENELSSLENELEALENAEFIKSTLFQVKELLQEEQKGVLSKLKDAKGKLSSIEKYFPDENFTERLQISFIELQELARDLENQEEKVEYDTAKINILRTRYDQLNYLLNKHHTKTVEELIVLRDETKQKLDETEFSDEKLEELELRQQNLEKELFKKAEKISGSRKKTFEKIELGVNQLLEKLNMKEAYLKIDQQTRTELNENGLDQIKILLKTNKGSDYKEVHKAASGGELSRVMLALKYMMSQNMALPTVIFDEIDTGVSGDTAHKMGILLEEMSENIQIIAITHLPQVASKGKTHFKVYKESSKDKTHTRVSALDAKARIEEIAKLLSSSAITQAAIANAKELLKS